MPLKFQYINKKTQPSWHLFVIQVDQEIRDKLFYFLKSRNIQSNLHYIPIYKHPYYKKMNFNMSNFKNNEEYFKNAISIPIYPGIKKKNIFKVINTLKKIFHE